ncbi:MAG: DMT family transporter [bacterium]|nr:DMT family transporter [bacterium]
MTSLPYFGELLALITAVVWAVAVILFKKSGESVHPIALNLFKNVLAAALVVPTLYLVGGSLWRPVSAGDYLILLVSGVLGIGFADTFFFMSLNILGAGLSAIVDCLYSPFVIALSVMFLSESLSLLQVLGVLMIVSAVLGVTSGKWVVDIPRHDLLRGTFWAVAALLLMAAGIVMAKPVLERSPLVWAMEWRLIGGILALLVIMALRRDRRAIISTLMGTRHWGYVVSGSWFGAYAATFLWLGGMKYTQASTASALNQTSNIFIFVLAALLLREPITLARTVAIVLGVAGAYLVTFG